MFAAACCTAATALALWNAEQPSLNDIDKARDVLAHSRNPVERAQAVTRIANEAMALRHDLQRAAEIPDDAGKDAKLYLRRLSDFFHVQDGR